MADHTEAQAAFCALLTSSSASRVLLVEGATETGKTHLSRQMERNVAEHLPFVRCGRFDFKGTNDRQIELDGFAQSLGLSTPSGDDLSTQLPALVRALADEPRPTVLIFDTYQEAGSAQHWVERVFLGQLLRTEWLRVVVLGQRIPRPHDAVWRSVAADVVSLHVPGPADWFAYACEQRPDDDIQMDFVVDAHGLADGRPGVLSALFGKR